MKVPEPWGDCPIGVVADLAGRLRRRNRQKQGRAAISMGLVVLLLSAVGYGLAIRDVPSSRAGLNCRETIPLLAKYHSRALDAADESDVREHLSHCPSCRKRYEELYPSEAKNRSSAEKRLIALAAPFSP